MVAVHLPSKNFLSVQPQDAVVDRIVGDSSDVVKRPRWEGPRGGPTHGSGGRNRQVVDVRGGGYQDEGVSGYGEERENGETQRMLMS